MSVDLTCAAQVTGSGSGPLTEGIIAAPAAGITLVAPGHVLGAVSAVQPSPEEAK